MIPQTEVQVPTKEQLVAQLNQLVIQRAGAKDQIDALEKQIPVVNGMIQLLDAQEEVAKAATAKAAEEADVQD